MKQTNKQTPQQTRNKQTNKQIFLVLCGLRQPPVYHPFLNDPPVIFFSDIMSGKDVKIMSLGHFKKKVERLKVTEKMQQPPLLVR